MQNIINLQKKKSFQRNQNLSKYYNSITIYLNFQHKPKISSFQNPHVKLDLLLLPRGQNPLKLYNNESKHHILALVGKVNKAPSQGGQGRTKRERESPSPSQKCKNPKGGPQREQRNKLSSRAYTGRKKHIREEGKASHCSSRFTKNMYNRKQGVVCFSSVFARFFFGGGGTTQSLGYGPQRGLFCSGKDCRVWSGRWA